ncbi:hypothetical protein EV651_13233 [Kribbella sp. VKM Ac-2571]|nr:hypothetical protein EV651_13233 [Kribbella sp. VKM Ac-2571]
MSDGDSRRSRRGGRGSTVRGCAVGWFAPDQPGRLSSAASAVMGGTRPRSAADPVVRRIDPETPNRELLRGRRLPGARQLLRRGARQLLRPGAGSPSARCNPSARHPHARRRPPGQATVGCARVRRQLLRCCSPCARQFARPQGGGQQAAAAKRPSSRARDVPRSEGSQSARPPEAGGRWLPGKPYASLARHTLVRQGAVAVAASVAVRALSSCVSAGAGRRAAAAGGVYLLGAGQLLRVLEQVWAAGRQPAGTVPPPGAIRAVDARTPAGGGRQESRRGAVCGLGGVVTFCCLGGGG